MGKGNNKGTVAPSATVSDDTIKGCIEALVTGAEGAHESYAALDRSGKGRVRSAIEARSKSTIAKADPTDPESAMAALVEAKRLAAIVTGLASVRGTASRTPRDPAEVLADRIATLRLAADLLESGMVAPDGVEPVSYESGAVRALVSHVDYAAAVALAEAKVTRSPNQYRVADGLAAAFAGHPVGTVLTIGQVCAAWDEAGGPAKEESSGRVSSRVFAPGGCTITWVEPVPPTGDAPKSVRLIAPVPTA